jgi:hypothetical protein
MITISTLGPDGEASDRIYFEGSPERRWYPGDLQTPPHRFLIRINGSNDFSPEQALALAAALRKVALGKQRERAAVEYQAQRENQFRRGLEALQAIARLAVERRDRTGEH